MNHINKTPFIQSARIIRISNNDLKTSQAQLPVIKMQSSKNIIHTETPDIMQNIKKQFLMTNNRNFRHHEAISPMSSISIRIQSPDRPQMITSLLSTKKIELQQRSPIQKRLNSPQLQARRQSPIQTHRIVTCKNIKVENDLLSPVKNIVGPSLQIKKNRFLIQTKKSKQSKTKEQDTECSLDYKQDQQQTNIQELPSIMNNYPSSDEDSDVSIVLNPKKKKKNSIILIDSIENKGQDFQDQKSDSSKSSEEFFNALGEEEYYIWGTQKTFFESSNENQTDSGEYTRQLREFFYMYKDKYNNYPNQELNPITDEDFIQTIALLTDECQRRFRKILISSTCSNVTFQRSILLLKRVLNKVNQSQNQIPHASRTNSKLTKEKYLKHELQLISIFNLQMQNLNYVHGCLKFVLLLHIRTVIIIFKEIFFIFLDRKYLQFSVFLPNYCLRMQIIDQLKQNLKLFTAFIDSDQIILRPTNFLLGIKTQIVIERSTGYIQEQRTSSTPQDILIPSKQFSIFMGVLNAGSQKFLTLCQDCIQLGKVLEADIYKIETVSFLPLDIDFNKKNKDIYKYLQDLKNFFSFGFYFSIPGNLTYSTQARNSSEDWGRESAEQFMWNSNMMEDLIALGISSQWIQPIIQGYVGGFQCEVKGQVIDVVMISRRSRHQGGTRYNSRGINDDGYVANFVETEIVMIFKEFLTSYICLRGSVPAFWSQEGMNTPIKLTRPVELTTRPFLKHAYQMVHVYGKIKGVDLMSPTKPYEANLSNAYTTLIEITGVGGFEYQNIDFHHVSSNTDCSGVNPFIHNNESIMLGQKYYAEVLETRKPSLYQKGVFRVNCVDCLDRTNAFMTKLVFMATLNIMNTMDAKLQINNKNPLDILDEPNNEGTHPFIVSFKNLWADNGDHLSYIYAGTGCTTSEVTRQGKQGLLGIIGHGFKALTRYYNSNFNDENKQFSINAILRGIKFKDDQSHYEKYMMNKEKDFSFETSQVSIYTLTWNLGGRVLPKENIEFFVDFKGLQSADIICVGLQEIINPQECDIDEINQTVANQLEKIGKYVLIGERYYLENYQGVWIKLQLVERFSNIEIDTHKFGSVSNLGNKGAIFIRFRIDDSLISFISCHLNAGTKKVDQRFEDIQTIWDSCQRSSRVLLNNSTYTILFGNLNFRIDSNYTNIVKKIEKYKEALQNNDENQTKQIFNQLLQQDQFNQLRYKCSALYYFKEAEITFLPTYKFDISSENYDTSKKQRTPSWCDRILIQALEFEQKFYESRMITVSDHRPVVAYYIIKIRRIDQIKKDQIKKEYYEKLSKGELQPEEQKRSSHFKQELQRSSETLTTKNSNIFTAFLMKDKKQP